MQVPIPLRKFGRHPEYVPILGLGGWHIGQIAKDYGLAEAKEVMHQAIDNGLYFFDNSWDYHDGWAEKVMGTVVAERRDDIFLMTKVCKRDYEGVRQGIMDSLNHLRTNHLDLLQFHECNYDNDPDWLLSRGALTAALEAAMEGKIRHLGFTGHKHPDIHRKMLNLLEWNWDSTQMPINVCDFHFRSFHSLLQPCAEHGVATIGMKSLGGRADDGSGVLLRTGITAEECIRYSLSQAITTLIVGISNRDELYQALNIGIDFSPMSSQEQADLRDRVREMAADGRFELFKTTQKFDGDYHRAQHDF